MIWVEDENGLPSFPREAGGRVWSVVVFVVRRVSERYGMSFPREARGRASFPRDAGGRWVTERVSCEFGDPGFSTKEKLSPPFSRLLRLLQLLLLY